MEVQETKEITEAADRVPDVAAIGSGKKRIWDKWFPRTVRIAAFEQHGTRLIISDYIWESGVVIDSHWGKAADLGNATPVKITVDGKESVGFFVDGDRGVAISIKPDDGLASLTTSPRLAFAWVDTLKLVEGFAVGLTGYEKIKFILIGAVPFLLLMWLERM